MTPSDYIRGAMKEIGALAVGETPTAAELADGLLTLNGMLRSWSAKRLLVYYVTIESFNLAAATASYAIGSGATWNTARPVKIEGAFVRDSNGGDHPVGIIGESRYRGLVLKSNGARPDRLWYNPTYPTGTIYLFPTPAEVEALWLHSLKQFTAITSGMLTTDYSIPGEYEEAIRYNLAVRLAPGYRKSVSMELAALAGDSLDTIRALNAAAQVEPVYAEPAVASGGCRYDINQG